MNDLPHSAQITAKLLAAKAERDLRDRNLKYWGQPTAPTMDQRRGVSFSDWRKVQVAK